MQMPPPTEYAYRLSVVQVADAAIMAEAPQAADRGIELSGVQVTEAVPGVLEVGVSASRDGQLVDAVEVAFWVNGAPVASPDEVRVYFERELPTLGDFVA